MPGITVLFFALIGVGMIYVLIGSRHQGAWDDDAHVTAAMKKRGWKVKPKIDEATSFLLGSHTPGEMWPIIAGQTGVQGIAKDSWKAVTLRRGSDDQLVISLQLAQRSDGAIAQLAEALVKHRSETFDLRTVVGTTPDYFTPDLRTAITSWTEMEFLYFHGEHLTVGVPTEHGRPDIIDYLEENIAKLRAIGKTLPAQVWS